MSSQIILNIENFWCERMTVLVDEGRLEDADALYSEFSVDDVDPTEWFYAKYLNS
mgnify:CR=1 FL=1|tara:strand:+ start:297 stop:461 length:165 start_codon:yes stop_codon:yes gene_type:complete